jgi:hypothetical protein
VICGKVEQEGHCSRRFALVRSVAEQPNVLLRAALLDQDWREGSPVPRSATVTRVCPHWCDRRRSACKVHS